MNEALVLFKSLVEEKEMHCSIVDEEKGVCRMGFDLDATSIEMYIFFAEDYTDAHVEGGQFVSIPDDKGDAAIKACNECNKEYRWVKFVYDEEDGTVSCKCDAVIQLDTSAEEVFEIVMRTAGIVNSAYPKFMKKLWA